MAAAADILPGHDSWPSLYDRARLSVNEVPGAAAVYYDDMYVPQQFSVDTAARIGGLKRWVTSEYEHDGLRVSGGGVLHRLVGMVRGTPQREAGGPPASYSPGSPRPARAPLPGRAHPPAGAAPRPGTGRR